MKRGTPDHPKVRRLIRRLRVHEVQVLGHLELLWGHFVPTYAPRGDVGRLKDQDIEDGVRWNGKAGAFVAALLAEELLDEDRDLRLVVHDWPEHADGEVHRKLARACQRFADGTVPKLTGLGAVERQRAEAVFNASGRPPASREMAAGQQAAAGRPVDTSLPRRSPPFPAPPFPADQRNPPHPPAAGAAGGPASLTPRELARREAEVCDYWRELAARVGAGRPNRERRREVREHLRQGWTVADLKASASEHVRSKALAAGVLREEDEWPPGPTPATPAEARDLALARLGPRALPS